jgi:hypothetical protein
VLFLRVLFSPYFITDTWMLLDGLALWLPAFSPDYGQVATLSLNGQSVNTLFSSFIALSHVCLTGSAFTESLDPSERRMLYEELSRFAAVIHSYGALSQATNLGNFSH